MGIILFELRSNLLTGKIRDHLMNEIDNISAVNKLGISLQNSLKIVFFIQKIFAVFKTCIITL